MTDQGERAPKTESAASIVGRSAAIDAAFADFPELDDDYSPPAVESDPVEKPADDDQPDSASTKPESEELKPTVDDSTRPVEGQEATPKSQDALDAPKHWPKDRRDQFQTLPDDAKRIILDRNKEANVAVTRAQQEAAQYRRTHESLSAVFSDDQKREMQQAGFDEIGAVKYLTDLHTAFNRDPLSVFAQVAQNRGDPVGFLKAAAERLGVKAEQLFGQPGTQPQPPVEEEWKDPAVAALEKQLADLAQWKTTQEQQATQAKETEQQRYQDWFAEQLNAFEFAIADDGNPKYPHLETVMKDVVRLVRSDPESNALLRSRPHEALEKAYQQALYLNPEIRQQIIDDDFAKRMSASEAANSVKKAQAAATRKGSVGANGAAQPKAVMSRQEAIDKAFADAGL